MTDYLFEMQRQIKQMYAACHTQLYVKCMLNTKPNINYYISKCQVYTGGFRGKQQLWPIPLSSQLARVAQLARPPRSSDVLGFM